MKRKYKEIKDEKDKIPSVTIAPDTEDPDQPVHHDHPDEEPEVQHPEEKTASMDKLRRIHDKIRRSQPRETTDDMGREVPEPQKVFKTKPVKSNGPNPEAAEPELNIPQPNS